ncbi:MAG: hypothetical protein EA425_13940 [Puniceicoccaceae bacterium]|nr:MAG: hypothetical protein EA425_13940 [Puniceicoccaceae bacterium]
MDRQRDHDELPDSIRIGESRSSGRLRRLNYEAYRGHATVHWSMTLHDRKRGWLDTLHHRDLREIMLHVGFRYGLVCPAYCLMPDHAHFVWCGITPVADQRRAMAWFRRQWNALLWPGFLLQRQAFDHVLRERERAPSAFATLCDYVLSNPVRAGLVEVWKEWPFLGAVFPGVYPLDPRDALFWDRFWREYNRRVAPR